VAQDLDSSRFGQLTPRNPPTRPMPHVTVGLDQHAGVPGPRLEPDVGLILAAGQRPPGAVLGPPLQDSTRERQRGLGWRGPNGDDASGLDLMKARGIIGHPLGKNPGDVWALASSNYRGAHHATFPLTLARRVIQAGSPEARCVRCRAPWQRRLLRPIGGTAIRGALGPTCDCGAAKEPAVVLDPFFGTGTTAVAAEQLGRHWLGIELNPAFADLARQRVYAARAGPQAI
jgi:hypothetical protein